MMLPFAGKAQDIHFSQFYASPLTLNPALSGYIDGDYRLAGIYRNQWGTVTTPFITYAGSFDLRVPIKKLKGDILGAGITLVNDRSGDQGLKTFSGSLSISYHKQLGAKKKHYLGLGIQLGYTQRSIDQSKLTFPSQHDGNDFNTGLPSGENLSGNTGYFDMNLGLLYSAQVSKRVGLFNGVSLFHLTQPKETFINDNGAHLKMRYAIHGGARIQLARRWYLTPNYIVMLQNKAREINFGTAVEYHLGENSKTILSLGGWYRLEDSGIISAGIEFMKVRVGVSYDVTTSGLQEVPKPTGGFEISLIYTGIFPKNDVGPILVPCPRL
jgi:type IX secretion system PorP/SprF family membrane protein